MQKKYSIEVDCANCAAAVERKLAEGVDEKGKLKEMLKVARKIEPDFEIED